MSEIRELGIGLCGEANEDCLAAIHMTIFKRGLKKVIDLLTMREHCAFELRQKLKLKDYPEFMIELILERARELRFLNEARYAECYIRSNIEKKGKNLIINELRNKGISEEYIYDSYEVVAADFEYSEEETIKSILEKKFYNVDFTDEKAKNRVISYFLRHGYSLGSFKNYLT